MTTSVAPQKTAPLAHPARPAEALYRFDRTTTALPGIDAALTEAACASFARDGFLAVENILTPAEIEGAKAELLRLIRQQVDANVVQPEPEVAVRWPSMTAEEKVDSVRKLYLFLPYSDYLASIAKENTALQRILSHLLGEPCHLIQDMALLKPPYIGTEKPWHQDAAYFDWGPPERVIGVWIALDPATAENGCMHALPGTHWEGPVPHSHIRDCQISDERVEVDRDVLVPLAPGGAMFFSSLVHHGTPPNTSPNRRWALQFHYAGASSTKMTLHEHADLFFEGDVYAGCRHGATGKPLNEVLKW